MGVSFAPRIGAAPKMGRRRATGMAALSHFFAARHEKM
jgi:hypothetical protein